MMSLPRTFTLLWQPENDSGDAGSNFPGCINGPYIYTVASINCDKSCAFYSNYNSGVVEWLTVGTNVFSTYKGGNYAIMSGTSMSTAVVTGIIHSRGDKPLSLTTQNCAGTNYDIAKK